MNNIFSNNVNNVEISGIRKFFNKVSKVQGAISLTLGQPDFPVPTNIKKAMTSAINENKTEYTANAGIPELRHEISNFLGDMDINYLPEEVVVTVGGSEALLCTFAAFLNPGDKVLIPSPAYPAYESCVKLFGAEVVNYNLNSDFTINFETLSKLISEGNPKLLVVSYPSNPTGAALSLQERDKLFKILKEKNIYIISDEIYSSLCYEKYYSLAQIDELRDRVILVSGFSKMFSMTGLRVGYVCASKYIMDNILKVHQYNVSCATSIAQWGAYAGLLSCMNDVNNMKVEFEKRKEYVYKRLIGMGMEVTLPKGAFYIFPSITKFSMNSEEFCNRLLYEGKVAIVPGSAFGTGGEGFIRISYSYSFEVLKEGLDRMEKWLKMLNITE
ncbi:aminotransferase class I/II-fold pyridoxal phosphate-dependent enzyme [Clostridium tagluense]|uniref:pyridoxal phosphate-dependent aminotransferase n=1 Tax=Clostridium tagluense TaxID=360422 RepID=UPI001CF17D25|nr:aminotransferase class I/II-fold pyridoxal phosphate-dependent enzyme [Clostridium tagluense]MCB2312559.1 aminotransferase class I/II-fold pyridoxal phosphate-dependent enzyme [Clostridium tagluense]MCB2317174.1 aminotransferase class I/II-fold pyridoxal phosphate-dependent enzyme [Clostridium tagluense]MCB2322038.1 aminotransferase class I/II-fold pyridoxal phosphate-dependent enzyme [Clostridium tagluense]MCB2327123.1 aminotransferase class I/II-fold pyridoxal phosphate-dependent enzyme [C